MLLMLLLQTVLATLLGRVKCRQRRAQGWLRVAMLMWGMAGMAGMMSGCALPDKPRRAVLYDFGPGDLRVESNASTSTSTSTSISTALPPLALADMTTSGGVLDNQAVLYRLGYTDAQQLRPYSQARWSMPPAQLLRQRLRQNLSGQYTVFNAREGVALNRHQYANLRLLRLELEEFSQLFSAPETSVGVIRLHATLLEITPAGEKLLAQRPLVVQRPALTADAAGGVHALTAATDAAIEELALWLRQIGQR